MRILFATVLCFASLLANPYILPDPGNIGIGAFELWPTARSTALAGAITGLADEADATYFNPAGLAFQTTARANLDCGKWLPGVPPGMDYIGAAGGVPLRLQPLRSHHAYVSGDIVYMTTGGGGHGYLWRGYAAAQMAILLTSGLGAGIGLKVAHNTYSVTWAEREFEEGTAEAANLAVLYRPRSYISIGAALDNLGPRIVYHPSGDVAELPGLARLGVCWTPIDTRNARLRVMPELDKLLVGMFSDTAAKSLGDEWRDVWKAVGVEATAYNLVSLRLGYFEDQASERRGLCWGMGIGSDKLRLDVSNDADLYDLPTGNWKFSLVANDISGLFRRRS